MARMSSFLENVYSQIMDLPEGAASVSGNDVSFAAAEGNFAMSFVKKN